MKKFSSRTPGELKLETFNIHNDFEQIALLLVNYSKLPLKEKVNKDNNNKDKQNNMSIIDYMYLHLFEFHAVNREDLRLLRSQFFDVLRQLYLKMGKILYENKLIDNSRDILYLTYDEVMIKTLINKSESDNAKLSLKTIVEKRKQDYQEFAKIDMPKYFWAINNHIPVSLPFNSKNIPQFVIGQRVAPEKNFEGVKITGDVLLVTDPAETLAKASKENLDLTNMILVAKNTDPGYCPLLNIVKGVIVMDGGVLSHASIVTREINKPCIIGVDNITDYISHGNIKNVTMDLSTGRIDFNNNKQSENTNP